MNITLNGAWKEVKEIGLPLLLAGYLLYRLDGQMAHLIKTTDEINARLLVALTQQVPHVPQAPRAPR